jgi:hypothetical protein
MKRKLECYIWKKCEKIFGTHGPQIVKVNRGAKPYEYDKKKKIDLNQRYG